MVVERIDEHPDTAELWRLDDALDALERERRTHVVELAGDPGIGKTRLLAELARRARERGLLVLSGGASELDGEYPFVRRTAAAA